MSVTEISKESCLALNLLLPRVDQSWRRAGRWHCACAIGETRGWGASLAVEGREAEIFALLSLARGAAVRPNVLHGFHGVSKSLARGEIVAAMIRLEQIGLPALRGPREAEMLKAGAMFLDKGFSPWAILRAAGIEGRMFGCSRPNGTPICIRAIIREIVTAQFN